MNTTATDFVVSNSSQITVPIPTHQADWIIPIFVNTFLLLLSIWALISLVHYGVKTGKWSQTQRSNAEKLNAGLIYTSVVLCALSCSLRYIFTLAYLNIGYGYGNDRLCDIFSDLTSSFYTLVLFSSALFSWSRQRLFYANRMLNVNYSKPIKIVSRFSIGVILVCGIGVLIFSVVPNDHPSSLEGCTYNVASDNLRVAYWVSIVLALLFGQATVLFLFVHALRAASLPSSRKRHSSNGNVSAVDISSDHCSTNIAETTTDKRKKSGETTFNDGKSRKHIVTSKKKSSVDPVKGILRITFLFATISLVVDILIQVFSFFISTGHRRIVTTLLNISSFLNLLLIVLAFKQYKKMLFSWFYK